MKILITGGNGFIGSKIVEMLSPKHSITVLDNDNTYGLISEKELKSLGTEFKTLNEKEIIKQTSEDLLSGNAIG